MRECRRFIFHLLLESAVIGAVVACDPTIASAIERRPAGLYSSAKHRQRLDLFGSVVQTLLDSSRAIRSYLGRSSTSGSAALTVDARPFHSRASGGPEDELMVASMKTLAVAEPALLEARRRQLKNLGVPEGDALALNDCPGALVPAPAKRICPDHGVLVAMVSLPDSIGPRRFVQIVLIAADSDSKTALVLGYVMEPRGDRWALVSQRLPVYVE